MPAYAQNNGMMPTAADTDKINEDYNNYRDDKSSIYKYPNNNASTYSASQNVLAKNAAAMIHGNNSTSSKVQL